MSTKPDAKYHILIDRDACVSDKLCQDHAPDVFTYDDEGKPVVMTENTDWPKNLLWIAKNCPVQAVKIIDAETGEQVWPPVRTV
ncbi:MAG TPA: ferredoxin [Candidatus Krumholzibacteria bacterium]|nr:ferredoxin [Candidatus Krumholzibacteria bacterium]